MFLSPSLGVQFVMNRETRKILCIETLLDWREKGLHPDENIQASKNLKYPGRDIMKKVPFNMKQNSSM